MIALRLRRFRVTDRYSVKSKHLFVILPGELAKHAISEDTSSREIQTSVRLILPGELAKHAISVDTPSHEIQTSVRLILPA
jgi:hypothetical protein